MDQLPPYPPPYPPQKRSILTENVYVPNDIENAIHHWFTAIHAAHFTSAFKNISVSLTTKHHVDGACLNIRTYYLGFRLYTLSRHWEYSEWKFGLISGHHTQQIGRSPPIPTNWREQKIQIDKQMDAYEQQYDTLCSFMGLVLSHLEKDEGFPHQVVKQWLQDNPELSPKLIQFDVNSFISPLERTL